MYDLLLGEKTRKFTHQLDRNLLMGDPIYALNCGAKADSAKYSLALKRSPKNSW